MPGSLMKKKVNLRDSLETEKLMRAKRLKNNYYMIHKPQKFLVDITFFYNDDLCYKEY